MAAILMSEIHFRLHIWPFQIKTQHSFLSQNGCHFDVRNSFSFAYLAISDQNATFTFILKMATAENEKW